MAPEVGLGDCVTPLSKFQLPQKAWTQCLEKALLFLNLEGGHPPNTHSPGAGSGNPLQYSCLKNPMER